MALATPVPSAQEAVDEGIWRRTLAVAWIGQVGSIMGFSFAMPLIPLFLKPIDDARGAPL